MIDISKIAILANAITTLKEASKDSHNSYYMTESLLAAVDFDKVKKDYIKTLTIRESPASSDAFFVDKNGEMYLIEFKNMSVGGKLKHEIWLKIFDSLLILTDILDSKASLTRQNLNYILVYSREKNRAGKVEDDIQASESRVDIENFFTEEGKNVYIQKGLERFKGLYFKDVFTVTECEFQRDFIKDWSAQ